MDNLHCLKVGTNLFDLFAFCTAVTASITIGSEYIGRVAVADGKEIAGESIFTKSSVRCTTTRLMDDYHYVPCVQKQMQYNVPRKRKHCLPMPKE